MLFLCTLSLWPCACKLVKLTSQKRHGKNGLAQYLGTLINVAIVTFFMMQSCQHFQHIKDASCGLENVERYLNTECNVKMDTQTLGAALKCASHSNLVGLIESAWEWAKPMREHRLGGFGGKDCGIALNQSDTNKTLSTLIDSQRWNWAQWAQCNQLDSNWHHSAWRTHGILSWNMTNMMEWNVNPKNLTKLTRNTTTRTCHNSKKVHSHKRLANHWYKSQGPFLKQDGCGDIWKYHPCLPLKDSHNFAGQNNDDAKRSQKTQPSSNHSRETLSWFLTPPQNETLMGKFFFFPFCLVLFWLSKQCGYEILLSFSFCSAADQ